MAARTQPDVMKVFAEITMIINSREGAAKVKLTSVKKKSEREERYSKG